MNADQLRILLGRPEGATLEFKRTFYALNDLNQQVKEQQRNEFIKDVLALANGSAATAGETAYLIIGADDKVNANGTRDLFDVTAPLPDQRTLLGYVQAACDPQLDAIYPQAITLDGVRLIVITIPPTPHLYETRRPLKTTGQTYTEHVVLYRENAAVKVASARQREAIQLLKRRRYADLHNAPPHLFGAAIGAIAGGVISDQYARKPPPGPPGMKTVVGAFVGALLGGGLGWSYRDLRRLWFDPSIESTPGKVAYIAALGVFTLGAQSALRWLFSRFRRPTARVVAAPSDPPIS